MTTPTRKELEEAKGAYEQVKQENEQDLETIRTKLRQIGSAPDPIAALVKALRGEDDDYVYRRPN